MKSSRDIEAENVVHQRARDGIDFRYTKICEQFASDLCDLAKEEFQLWRKRGVDAGDAVMYVSVSITEVCGEAREMAKDSLYNEVYKKKGGQ